MFLIGFFASPLPYIILVAAYLSGFVVYYVKGNPGDEADVAFFQEDAHIASATISSDNGPAVLALFADREADDAASLPSGSQLQVCHRLPEKYETPPPRVFHDKKQFSVLHIRPPPTC